MLSNDGKNTGSGRDGKNLALGSWPQVCSNPLAVSLGNLLDLVEAGFPHT